jgi:hypothetical protein
MSTPSAAPAASKTKFRLAQAIGYTSLLVLGFLNVPEWAHTPLIALVIGASVYACFLAIKSDKERKEWQAKQPGYVDPYKGSPAYPHRHEEAAMIVGIFSFMAFVYLALPMRDRALSSNDLWVLLPLLLMIASFGYARRISKKYSAARAAWRELQQAGDTALK